MIILVLWFCGVAVEYLVPKAKLSEEQGHCAPWLSFHRDDKRLGMTISISTCMPEDSEGEGDV